MPARTAPHLSVVIPFRNEAGSLGPLYRELAEVLDGLVLPSEMIFVDDGSEDDGWHELLSAAASDPRLRLLSLSSQTGQSAALEAGFRAARGTWVATLDADGQNDPHDLPRLLAATAGVDCVNGFRRTRRDRWDKRWASRLANGIRRRVLGDSVEDIGCSLRVMRAERLARIKLFRGSHRFLPALLEMEGARILEIPVAHRPRRHGQSKYAIRDRLAATGVDLLAAVWMKRRIQRYDVKEVPRRTSPGAESGRAERSTASGSQTTEPAPSDQPERLTR